MKVTNKRGFTVTELVIVIAVIAILAAVLIPTFTSLIKRANESVDIQMVRQMNEVLKMDEPVNGKPKNIEQVKSVLTANGIAKFEPTMADSAFAWDGEENMIILVDKVSGKGIFPKEYKNVAYKDTWPILAGTVQKMASELGATIDEALQNIKLGETLVLEKDEVLDLNTLPANASIDLNGKTLTTSGMITVPERGNVTITGGELEMDNSFSVKTGSVLVLDDVDIKAPEGETLTYAIYPSGDASRVDIKDCTIDAVIGVSTNANGTASDHVVVNVSNCTFGSAEKPVTVGLWVNVRGEMNVYNTTIYADGQCVMVRGGEAYLDNCNLIYKNTEAYVEQSAQVDIVNKTKEENKLYRWGEGNQIQHAALVVGDFAPYSSPTQSRYHVDATCTLKNVTITVPTGHPQIYLSQDSGNTTNLNTNGASYDVRINNPTNPNAWYYQTSSDPSGYIKIEPGNIYVNGVKKN